MNNNLYIISIYNSFKIKHPPIRPSPNVIQLFFNRLVQVQRHKLRNQQPNPTKNTNRQKTKIPYLLRQKHPRTPYRTINSIPREPYNPFRKNHKNPPQRKTNPRTLNPIPIQLRNKPKNNNSILL